jgi:hypothetical protein
MTRSAWNRQQSWKRFATKRGLFCTKKKECVPLWVSQLPRFDAAMQRRRPVALKASGVGMLQGVIFVPQIVGNPSRDSRQKSCSMA